METPPPNNATAPPPIPVPAGKAKLPLPATLAEFAAASGGNTARALLHKLGKGAISIPSPEDIRTMVQTLLARPDGALRLIFLLQALDEAVGSLRESILALTEAYLRERDTFPSSPPPLSAAECVLAVGPLLRPADPKDAKPKLDLFGLFLLLAFHRGWLGESDAFALLERAFPQPKPKRDRSNDAQPAGPSPLAIILGTPLRKPNLPPLLALHSAWETRTAASAAHVRQLEANIARLENEKSLLRDEVQATKENITELEADVAEKSERILDLEKELTDAGTAARHRYDALKGRVRGFLGGELSRWLQNASEAANLEPPRVRVIQERLQSAVSSLQKETQWLQSLD